MQNKWSFFFASVITAGILLMLIGIYLYIFKAGIPYQNPTEKMAIQWMAYHIAGVYSMKYGAITISIGIVLTFVTDFSSLKKMYDFSLTKAFL